MRRKIGYSLSNNTDFFNDFLIFRKYRKLTFGSPLATHNNLEGSRLAIREVTRILGYQFSNPISKTQTNFSTTKFCTRNRNISKKIPEY